MIFKSKTLSYNFNNKMNEKNSKLSVISCTNVFYLYRHIKQKAAQAYRELFSVYHLMKIDKGI